MRRWWMAAGLLVVLGLGAGCQGDPKTPAYWEKAVTKAKRPQDRTRIFVALRESKVVNAQFLPFLHGMLGSDVPGEVRQEVVRLIGTVKDPSSVQPLIGALEWGNADVALRGMNKEIANALAEFPLSTESGATLIRLLKNNDMPTRIAAAKALGKLQSKDAVDPLIAMVSDESSEPLVIQKGIEALGDLGDPRAVDVLVQLMFKEPKRVSFYGPSSFALFQLGAPSATRLLPILSGQDKPFRAWAEENGVHEPALYAKAAQVLGDLGDKRAVPGLVSRLNFQHPNLAYQLLVRMKSADALGRIRASEGVRPISGMVKEEEPNARNDYARALVYIGGRDGLPSLLAAAAGGDWDARDVAMKAAALLGDEREEKTFQGFLQAETAKVAAECKEYPDNDGCSDVAATTKKRTDLVQGYLASLAAGKECKGEIACWAKKLEDGTPVVRERAAFELGRSSDAAALEPVFKHLSDKENETRSALAQAGLWLVNGAPQAKAKAQSLLPGLDQQLESERGQMQFVKVNEDLRRLAVAARRPGA